MSPITISHDDGLCFSQYIISFWQVCWVTVTCLSNIQNNTKYFSWTLKKSLTCNFVFTYFFIYTKGIRQYCFKPLISDVFLFVSSFCRHTKMELIRCSLQNTDYDAIGSHENSSWNKLPRKLNLNTKDKKYKFVAQETIIFLMYTTYSLYFLPLLIFWKEF